MVKCEVCGKEFLSITNTHLSAHKVTQTEYKFLFLDSCISSSETRTKRSNTMRKKRADPLSVYNTPEHSQKQMESHREAWLNPKSGYNSPDFGKKISESVSRRFSEDPTYSKRVSTTISKLRQDPNSAYNSPQFREALKAAWANPNSGHHTREQGGGFGKTIYASDGHRCQSSLELIFEEWLIDRGISHIPHPSIPGNSAKRADQLVSGYYIEVDGMSRTTDYWAERYRKNISYLLVVLSEQLTFERLDNYLLGILLVEAEH